MVECSNTLEFRPPPLFPFYVAGVPPLEIIKRDDDLIMSLTSFLNKKDVREKFREEYPKPRFDIKKEILLIKQMKSLFLKQRYPIRTKLQWDSGLDKISLRNKILNDLDNLNMNDTANFLKVYLKTNRFFSTKIFIKFLLKETELLSHYPVYDKEMLYKLRFIRGNLLKKGLIKPYNSQVYRIV